MNFYNEKRLESKLNLETLSEIRDPDDNAKRDQGMRNKGKQVQMGGAKGISAKRLNVFSTRMR